MKIINSDKIALPLPLRWMRDWGGILTNAFGLFAFGYVAWLILSGGNSEYKTVFTDVAMIPVTLVMTFLAWRASRHKALDGRTRRAWTILTFAFSAYFLGNCIWFYYEVILGIQPGVSWADPIYLAYYPLLLWGVLTFPMAQRAGKTRLTFGLDAGTVMVGAGMFIWYFLLRPIAEAEHSSFLETFITLAFPVGDMVLLFGIVAIVLRQPKEGVRRVLSILTLGVVMDTIADLGYGYQTLQGNYQGGNWPDKFYMVGFFLMALSAQYQHWSASHHNTKAERSIKTAPALSDRNLFSWLPYLGIALGYGLLLGVSLNDIEDDGNIALDELIIGAFIITAFVVARQIAAVRENMRLLKERAASQSEARFRSLVQNSSDVITILDPDTTINYESPSVETVFGYNQGELSGTKFLDLIHLDDRSQAEFFFTAAGQSPKAKSSVIWRLRHKSGDWLYVESTGANLLHDPNVCGIVVNSRDITERRNAEEALRQSVEQLRQSQKMDAVGQLAGGVAHDFNNLLAVIIGYSQILMRRMSPERDSWQYQKIVEIKKAGDRAASLTRQLLALSRKQMLQPRVLDLNSVVSEMEKMLRRLIGEDIEFRTALGPHLGRIKADPGQIEQVLMNLAVNARDAMPQGGKLLIETKNAALGEDFARAHSGVEAGQYVMIAVSDSGCGMNPETQERIFEPFFTTKEKGKGTGLGLSTVYGIVKQSGGHLWVYSEVGRGTTFKVYLPRADEKAKMESTTVVPDEVLTGTETVLLVEDEESVRRLAHEILEMNGYKVLAAEKGEEALKVSEQYDGNIQLMVTDVVMPKMSGRELAESLSLVRPDMRVLYMSGYTDDAIVHHGVLDHGMAFLEKPFSPECFARKVREVLRA